MIHVLTLTWNGLENLKTLTPGLLNSLNGMDYHWHIKDNASKDNSVNYLNGLDNKNITCYSYHNNNQNFAQGNNYLFDKVKPNDEDFILLLNNDVIINKANSISKMVRLFDQDNVGVVGAKLKYTNTNQLQHAGVVFSDSSRRLPFHFRANESDDKNSSKNREFQAVTGAVLLTKAKYYKNICATNPSNLNGLDESFVWAFEDIHACLSIKYEQNKRVLYCGETDISHGESVSLKKNPANKLFMPFNIRNIINKHNKNIVCDHDFYLKNSNYNVI